MNPSTDKSTLTSIPKRLSIMHFNDAYEIEASNIEPIGGVARFVTACNDFHKRTNNEGLLLFSGDLFSPSYLSMFYQGQQLIDPMNACRITAACVGNHEFDYGLERITELFQNCNFPWLCSNIYNTTTNAILADNHVYCIEERNGLRIGLIGLAEEEWLNTISEIDMSTIRYENFIECANYLATLLRETHNCDIIIALTHMRVPNDILLAQNAPNIDLILGGHDHIIHQQLINNSTLLIKSGSDFKNYGIIELETGNFSAKPLQNPPISPNPNQETTFILKNKLKVTVKFENITKETMEDPKIANHVNEYAEKSKKESEKIIGFTSEPLDTRFSEIRTTETNFGNFYIDVMRKEVNADIAIMNSGTIRSDQIFPEGPITLSLLNKALPFPDIIVVQQLSGTDIISALENGVSKWPSFDGRFPLVSNIRFSFNGTNPPGSRVLRESIRINNMPIQESKNYSCATKWFISQGKDGYTMFINKPFILDYQNGLPHLQIMVSFFSSSDENIMKCKKSNSNNSQETVPKLQLSHSSSDPTSKSTRMRVTSLIEGSNWAKVHKILKMQKFLPKLCRSEKVKQSGLVSQIKLTEDSIREFEIAPKKDGRITLIKNNH